MALPHSQPPLPGQASPRRLSRFSQLRGHGVVHRWRYRMAPDPLTRQPKGSNPILVPRPSSLVGVVAVAATLPVAPGPRRLGVGGGNRGDGAGQLPDHSFRVLTPVWARPRARRRRRGVPADDDRGHRGAVRARKPHRHPQQRRRSSTRPCSRRSSTPRCRSRSRRTSTGPGTSGGGSPRHWRRRRRPACGSRSCSMRSARPDDRGGDPQGARGRRLPARLVQPDPLITASGASTTAPTASR